MRHKVQILLRSLGRSSFMNQFTEEEKQKNRDNEDRDRFGFV